MQESTEIIKAFAENENEQVSLHFERPIYAPAGKETDGSYRIDQVPETVLEVVVEQADIPGNIELRIRPGELNRLSLNSEFMGAETDGWGGFVPDQSKGMRAKGYMEPRFIIEWNGEPGPEVLRHGQFSFYVGTIESVEA